MDCARVKYTGHALRRMFERGISRNDVATVLRRGQTIEAYPADEPLPSRLLLGFVGTRPLHVVVARDPATHECHVVTVYEPDPRLWQPDWKTRSTP